MTSSFGEKESKNNLHNWNPPFGISLFLNPPLLTNARESSSKHILSSLSTSSNESIDLSKDVDFLKDYYGIHCKERTSTAVQDIQILSLPGTELESISNNSNSETQSIYFNGEEHARLFKRHCGLVFILTFLAYACLHASRKPITIVKSILNPPKTGESEFPGWEPFVGPNGNTLLGWLDTSFLLIYALSMFVVAIPVDIFPLRRFLVFGMIISGEYFRE